MCLHKKSRATPQRVDRLEDAFIADSSSSQLRGLLLQELRLKKVFDINIGLESRGSNENAGVTIIPGNRYFRLEGKSYYFNRNMPLTIQGYE